MIEPLAVGFHAADQGCVSVGETVVILGAGCIGLVTLLACKARGAGKIIVTDLVDTRLEKAKELGADYVINGKDTDVLAKITELTNGKGADKVIETAGSAHTIAQTAHIVTRGGTIVLVGLAAVGCGEYSDIKTAVNALVKIVDTIEPQDSLAKKYENRYQKFKAIYPAIKGLFR